MSLVSSDKTQDQGSFILRYEELSIITQATRTEPEKWGEGVRESGNY